MQAAALANGASSHAAFGMTTPKRQPARRHQLAVTPQASTTGSSTAVSGVADKDKPDWTGAALNALGE